VILSSVVATFNRPRPISPGREEKQTLLRQPAEWPRGREPEPTPTATSQCLMDYLLDPPVTHQGQDRWYPTLKWRVRVRVVVGLDGKSLFPSHPPLPPKNFIESLRYLLPGRLDPRICTVRPGMRDRTCARFFQVPPFNFPGAAARPRSRCTGGR